VIGVNGDLSGIGWVQKIAVVGELLTAQQSV